MKKCLKFSILVLVITLLFSSCSFRIASSVDELISPVTPTGDNLNIQNVLNSYCKGGFSLKTPVDGEFTTSYIFYDIDNDKNDEAIAFYEPSTALGTINLAIIDKIDNQWTVVSNIVGSGSDIYSVDFSDVNGDSKPEIIVLWDAIPDSKSHNLSVYTEVINKDEIKFKQIGTDIKINDYITVDMDSDNVNEIMVFTLKKGESSSAYASLYSCLKNNVKLIAKTKLDGHISEYKNITSEKIDNTVYVYADALDTNGAKMHTEVIYWSDNYDSIISPFYDYSTGLTNTTKRNSMLTSKDINEDKMIEIPLDASIDNLPQNIEAINWKQFKEAILVHVCYSLAVPKDNYQMVISDEYFNDIKIKYDDVNSILTVYDSNDKMIFSVVSLLKSQYDDLSKEKNEYSEIMKDSGYIYLAKVGDESDKKITIDDLKLMIKPYKGE